MSENQPYHICTFSSGANYDGNIELSFSQPGSGIFIDARNAQSTSNDGETGAIEKIKGETKLYGVFDSSYKCIGAEKVNEYLIEFWAPSNNSFPGIVVVNGTVVLSSLDFPLSKDFPLNWDKNRSAAFSEIYITDNQPGNPPYIFNIKDMVDSVATQKYFSAFDPLLYQINLQSPLDTLVFLELVNVGGGGGLPVGHYQYQLRYSNVEGDRTQWSHPTPMIPVMEILSESSKQYPWVKTVGGPPNPSSKTAFAPRLRYRVTNLYDYDYIEIKRISYNAGAGVDYTSNGFVVARVDVVPGEISVREYIDPAESNENLALSAADETRELAHVDHCKDIRYFDRRLVPMNVTLASREANLTFKEIDELQGFPVLDKIYTAGYNDPWNHVYRKSEMRGEIVGYGVNLYDGVGNKGFTTKIPKLKNYQFPNRRDPITGHTANYSYLGAVNAADTTCNAVSLTHEVFDHVNAISKENYCDFKNIVEKGRVLGLTGTKFTGPLGVKQDCDESDAEIENHNANVSLLQEVSTAYLPFTPVKQNDPDVEGHNYVVNTKIAQSNVFIPNPGPGFVLDEPEKKVNNYRPRIFAPEYYAMGIMVAGIQNFPQWAKSFSIVRTPSAKRILCQGIGFYSMTKAKFSLLFDNGLGGKSSNKVWYYAPDLENGILSSNTVNDIIDNPQNYKVQFVSPLGFACEWYSAEDHFANSQRDRCVDMIAYARLLRDREADPNDQINPFESVNMGIPGFDGWNYVTYDKYRNLTNIPTNFYGAAGQGNRYFDIANVKRISNGRGTYLEIETFGDFYGTVGTGGDDQFEDNGVKNMHEPLYVINIIRTGAKINDADIQKYQQTTHYQKLESIIGKSTGLDNQRFLLVDERWEDCISGLNPGYYGATNDVFCYIKLESGEVQKWQNVTFKSLVDRANIIANIIAGIGDIKGIYTHNNINNLNREFELIFGSGTIPPLNSLIMVRYDDNCPIRVYGGDTYIGEAIFAPLDGQSGAIDDAAETQFAWGIGLPYKDFKINPRYYTIRKAGAGFNSVQDKEWFTIGYIRQLCVMFTVESRGAMHLAHNLESPHQYFPAINYVIRPNRWDRDKGYVDNYVFSDYADDYGDEKDQWKWGGFRFLPQINPDYSVMPPMTFFSKPEFGFVEIRHFPTRTMWGLPRSINVQNAPGLRTFPANNNFDIDDNMGEIKSAWSAISEKGENLYALTENGTCLLITKKTILSDLNGGEIGYMAADGFIRNQYWLSKEIGITDEMWRGSAEASVSMDKENGGGIKIDALFFINKLSVFRLMNNSITDIGRIDYYTKLFQQGIDTILPGYQTHITGIYDNSKEQYYLHIDNGENNFITFVFSTSNNKWFGTNDFRFDMFTSNGYDIYGHRNFETYKLNEGYVINGEPIHFEVFGAAAPEQMADKEFIRIRLNSNVKPTDIQFLKEKTGIPQCSLNVSMQGGLYLKNYNGWEQFIPRTEASVNINRPRLQGRVVLYKIIHNLASEFRIVDLGLQYKKIKM